MHRRSLIVVGLLFALALPLSASQFVDLPFEQVVNESQYIVRGTIGQTWSAWDDAHEVIYTYATINVRRHFGEAGPATLMIREVGGTVDGYTMDAIGFPVLRSGEDVVLMLSRWEDGADYRIHAFNQGKYLVRNRFNKEVLTADPVRQGEERMPTRDGHGRIQVNAADELPAISMDEFEMMVRDARAGREFRGRTQQQ